MTDAVRDEASIRLRNVVVRPPGSSKALLRVADLTLPAGSRVLIHGPSGVGKTTLLHLMAGLLAPESGQVLLGETDLTKLSDSERCDVRRQRCGIIFQTLSLLGHLTCEENVLLAARGSRGEHAPLVRDALERVNMLEHAQRPASRLSLGQKQRVAVARIIAARPRIVLADEPTSSLDDVNTDAILSALLSLSGADTTLVVVSHDQRVRERLPQHIDIRELAAT